MHRLRARVATVGVAAFLAIPTAVAPVAAQDAGPDADERALAWWVAETISGARSSAGAPPIEGWSDIDAIASAWSRQLAAAGELSHNPSYGAQMCCWRRAGEIIGMVSLDASDAAALREAADRVTAAWLDSPGHRDILLLADYDDIGVGVVIDRGTARAWITVDFRDRNATPDGTVTYRPGDAPPDAAACDGAPSGATVTRISGDDRIATAVALSGDVDRARNVILASSVSPNDALAATGLSGALAAPLLLTGADGLDPRVAAKLAALGPDRVVLLGGAAALSDRVAAQARRAVPGTDVVRLSGRDRFATAARIADAVDAAGGRTGRAIVVLGQHPEPDRSWVDAVAVSALAAANRHPILSTLPTDLPASTADALGRLSPNQVIVVGGTDGIREVVVRAIRRAVPDATVRRVAGATRHDTAHEAALLDLRWRDAAPTGVMLVDSTDWPDALVAGPSAARAENSLLLVDGRDTVDATTARLDLLDALLDRHGPLDATIAGGPSAIGPRREAEIARRVACAPG